MAQFNINDFRSALRADGARPTLFKVILTAPVFAALNVPQLSFMAKATQMPGSTIGTVQQSYFGRKIKLAGDRNIADWQITVINDETFDMYGAFERWINAMAHTSTRLNAQRVLGATSSPASYVGQALVQHYGKEGNVIRTMKLTNVWPSDVSPIDLSWDANDTIEEFGVTFNMDWFEVVDGVGPN